MSVQQQKQPLTNSGGSARVLKFQHWPLATLDAELTASRAVCVCVCVCVCVRDDSFIS